MSDEAFVATLGPKQIGAELLLFLAQGRMSGTLTFGQAQRPQQLIFREGRPCQAVDLDGQIVSERAEVVRLLRLCATCSVGRSQFSPGTVVTPALPVDTLGESLWALMQQFTATQVESVLSARAGLRPRSTPRFARLAAAVQQLGGPALSAPPATTLAQLTAAAEPPVQRAYVALLALGGLEAPDWQLQREPVAAAVVPAQQGMAQEIDAAFTAHTEQDHFLFLGVPRDASVEAVRRAYFDHAKRWHADRLSSLGLCESHRNRAEVLFRRAEEANRVLSDAQERQTYVWTLERQAQGLPTDPRVIVEAESLFRRGQAMLRRGEAAPALPLLQQAAERNPGEAEFRSHWGFALYGALGASALVAAREHLAAAIALRDHDVAHEFLGRIAHLEGDTEAARTHLRRALELEPKNVHAERELRLINLRQTEAQAASASSSSKGLLARVLGR